VPYSFSFALLLLNFPPSLVYQTKGLLFTDELVKRHKSLSS
jgi:hypothetical protein